MAFQFSLEIVYTSKGYREFESLHLRHFETLKPLRFQGFCFVQGVSTPNHTPYGFFGLSTPNRYYGNDIIKKLCSILRIKNIIAEQIEKS